MGILRIGRSNAHELESAFSRKGGVAKVYHPECGHCKDMAPAWDALDHHPMLSGLGVVIVDVHHEAIPLTTIPAVKGIQGFPTIIEIKPGGKRGREYNGDRSTEDMARFIVDLESAKGGPRRTKARKRRRRRRASASAKKSRRKTAKHKSRRRRR